MPFPYYEEVQRSYQELQSEGFIKELPAGHQPEVEEQKGILTRRSGYYANIQDPNIGILAKTSGNNSQGYSVDLLIHKVTGQFWDVATDNGRIAIPINGDEHIGTDLIPNWRQPTRELAGIGQDVPEPEPEPEPEPPPDGNINEKLDFVISQQQVIIESIALILARQDNADAAFNSIRLALKDVRDKQNRPYSYTNRFIGGVTPVGV